MLPIAVLPVAGLLLRLGQPDLLNIKWIADAGGAVFTNLPLIFAIGVAVGFAKENHGAAALAGAIGYLILTAVLKSINDKLDMGVLAGILCGIVAGNLYNRFKDIKMPEYLAFFGGKRFVPIITGLVCVVLGLLCGYIWPVVQTGIDWVGHALIGAGGLGLFIYGLLNRVLLVTGLHHILNSLVWFVFGSYTGADGKAVTGDLHRFFAGDPTAGTFMTGFFPVMMFGLPAACLAMYHAARPENRKVVGGLLMSMALTAFLTGVTEPVEFTFMFLAPILYVIHAILTGISMALMTFLGVRLGFTFSAGAFDYIISYRLGTNGWMLIPVGLVYFLIYYFLFSFAIRKFNLATPGRADASLEPAAEAASVPGGIPDIGGAQAPLAGAVGYVRALGGNRNLKLVDACTTRLRLEVVDDSLVNEAALRTLGARGIVRPSRNALQVVIGPQAEIVAGEIREAMAKGEYAAIGPAVQTPVVESPAVSAPAVSAENPSISERPAQSSAEDTAVAQRPVHAFGELILLAPVSGVIYPLERVPDPVFSQKLAGDGISIDPTDNVLRAPCPGEIVQQHAAGHAVTLKAAGEVEVLMHVGIDTVTLKGQGFTSRVKVGDKVETGAPLIEFDLDYVATNAKSLLTEVIISNGERVSRTVYGSGRATVGKTPVLTLTLNGGAAVGREEAGPTVMSEAIILPNPNGLHARPAAVLSSTAKTFKSDIRLQLGDRFANARSVTSLMALETARGDKVLLVAKGPDAREAVDRLTPMIAEGLGDEGCVPVAAPATMTMAPIAAPAPRKDADPNLITGVAASSGLAVGDVYQVRHVEIQVKEEGGTPDHERRLLDDAVDKAAGQLEALRAQLHGHKEQAKAAIFAAHSELLEDPDLIEIATSAIAKGKSAAFAWKSAVKSHAERLAGLRNQLLAQRANDLRDVGERVLEILIGIKREAPSYPANAVIIAEDLTPSDTAVMERGKVMGFATVRGGATSHVAILARSLGIPALAGIEARALELPNGTPVILDGSKGTLRLNPSPEEMKQLREAQIRHEQQRKEDLAHALEPATTTDGHNIEVAGNIGGLKDAGEVAQLGGDAVGLLRSEFLFMERSAPPSEDEQFEEYKAIALALGADRPLIIRTLDVGGDKPLAYLPIPKEDNPFLGERGIRVGLDRPEILRTQLRALLRASPFGKLKIMFPMIATIAELRDAKAILAEEAGSLGIPPMPCGIMVEIPAVAIMAEVFAKEADFFSIGTNDLTQYALAMDRGHPKLAPKVDALNPALLRLIALTVEGARKHKRFTGVCGGIAGDAQAVPILVGLGVDELSVSLPSIPMIKAQVRRLSYTDCQELAQRALNCRTGDEVRSLLPQV